MSDKKKNLSKEELWDEVVALKGKLAKERKLKKKYQDKVKLADRVITTMESDVMTFDLLKGNWLTIHFIPEYFGFVETVKGSFGSPDGIMRIYTKDNIAMSKMPNNKWMIAKTVEDENGNKTTQRAGFTINNKFEGYHVLRAFGAEVD